MATVRAMVWNIQNFGSKGDSYANYKGANSELLAEFIADVVRAFKIDVLMVLEVMPTAEPSLDNVMYALNRGLDPPDWCYDWVKCAVARRPEKVPYDDVETRDQLSWRGSRHAQREEGYAVFWRNSQTDRFTMQDAREPLSEGGWTVKRYKTPAPRHAIELTLRGREIEGADNAPWVRASNGFLRKDPIKHWDWSQYPDISKFASIWSPRWDRTRRPAVATIVLNTGGTREQTVVPIVAYHAPSRREPARMGIYLSGLARELYITHTGVDNVYEFHEKAIALGDYNLGTDDDSWDAAYVTYHRPFKADRSAGADMKGFNDDDDHITTTILLNELVDGKPIGPAIEGDKLRDFYRATIDNVFVRGLTNDNTYVCRLPADTMKGGVFTGDKLKRWSAHLDKLVLSPGNVHKKQGPRTREWVDGQWELKPIFPHMTDWTAFLAAVKRGWFKGDANTGDGVEARQAAEFIHDFVSDHLPLYVEFDVA
jgi:hypothetical protein